MKKILFSILFAALCMAFVPQSVKASTNYYYDTGGAETATPEQQTENAVQSIANISLSLADSSAGAAMDALTSGRSESRGLQFKDPVISPNFGYRWMDDTSIGGFSSHEYNGGLTFDADLYDGWIAGVLYQHANRSGQNALGVSENLASDAASFYIAKRFIDFVNAGFSYNYASTEHRLTRAVQANLDRDSHGFNVFAGLSDHKKNWSWSTTVSYAHVHDDYSQQKDLITGRFGLGGTLGYDVTKEFTLGAAVTYYYLVQQDTFSGSPRDNDYINLGPRFSFHPSDSITLRLDMDSMQGYTDVASYNVRAAVDIGF